LDLALVLARTASSTLITHRAPSSARWPRSPRRSTILTDNLPDRCGRGWLSAAAAAAVESGAGTTGMLAGLYDISTGLDTPARPVAGDAATGDTGVEAAGVGSAALAPSDGSTAAGGRVGLAGVHGDIGTAEMSAGVGGAVSRPPAGPGEPALMLVSETQFTARRRNALRTQTTAARQLGPGAGRVAARRTRHAQAPMPARGPGANVYSPEAVRLCSSTGAVLNLVMFWYLASAVLSRNSLAFTLASDLKRSIMLFSFSCRSALGTVASSALPSARAIFSAPVCRSRRGMRGGASAGPR